MRFKTTDIAPRHAVDRMTALIDVVFLLLIFLMLTLQISQPEGDFQLTMPAVSTAPGVPPWLPPPPIRVRLLAGEDGRLSKEIEVEIQADDRLNYEYLVRAVSACSGRLQRKPDGTTDVIRYVEKIKLISPPPTAGRAS